MSIATTATSSVDGSATPAPPPVDEGEGPRAILVTSQIENGSHLLKPELTGKVKIYCGQRRIIDLMTRRLARYVRVEPPVFKDYFDPKVRKVVAVVRKLRQVRVRFEVEETDIPAA